jgi:hypothetical protein
MRVDRVRIACNVIAGEVNWGQLDGGERVVATVDIRIVAIELQVLVAFDVVKLCQRSSGARCAQHGAAVISGFFLADSWCSGCACTVSIEAIVRSWGRALIEMATVLRRCVDHKKKALFGCGKLGDVVLGMRSTDMLLHGAVPLFADASLAAAGAVLVPERTDNLIIGVCEGKGRG